MPNTSRIAPARLRDRVLNHPLFKIKLTEDERDQFIEKSKNANGLSFRSDNLDMVRFWTYLNANEELPPRLKKKVTR